MGNNCHYIVKLIPRWSHDAALYLNGSHNIYQGTTYIFECAARFKTEDEAMGLLDQAMQCDYYRKYAGRWELLKVTSEIARKGGITSE